MSGLPAPPVLEPTDLVPSFRCKARSDTKGVWRDRASSVSNDHAASPRWGPLVEGTSGAAEPIPFREGMEEAALVARGDSYVPGRLFPLLGETLPQGRPGWTVPIPPGQQRMTGGTRAPTGWDKAIATSGRRVAVGGTVRRTPSTPDL